MSGGGQNQGMAAPTNAWQQPSKMGFTTKEAGNESGGGTPPEQPTTPTADPQPQGQGGMNMWRPGGFTSVPFMQTFGGQPAPYADLTAQILDSFRMTENGAGRFGNNMAARFSFQGGNAPWRQDHNVPRQPIAPYGYNPGQQLRQPWNAQPPGGSYPGGPGPGNGAPPMTGMPVPGAPEKPAPKGAAPGGDQMAQWQATLQSNPQLAFEMLNKDVGFYMNNKNAIEQAVGGDLGKWRNAHDSASSNRALITDPAQLAQLAAFGRR